jgi:hypothetical protein
MKTSDSEDDAALRGDDAAMALERRMAHISAAVLKELGHEPMALRAAVAILIVFEPEGIELWPRQAICRSIEATLEDLDDRAYAYAQTRPEPLRSPEKMDLVRRLRLLAAWAPGFDVAQTFGPQASEGAKARTLADAAASIDAMLSAFGPNTSDLGGVPEFMVRRATARLLLEGLDEQACAEATAFLHSRTGAQVARDLPTLGAALAEIAGEAPLAADILEVWQACAARLEGAPSATSVVADGLAAGRVG